VEDGGERLAVEERVGEKVHAGGRVGVEHEREEPVVRADEEPAAGPDRDRAPVRAHARVHDRHEHGAPREVAVGRVERERPREDVVGRHLVEHVRERRLRAGAEDRALHRAHVGVAQAEVRQEGDDGHHAGL